MKTTGSVVVASLCCCLFISLATGFLPSSLLARRQQMATHHRHHRFATRQFSGRKDNDALSPWKQQPGETEFAYLKRLQQMASNPPDMTIISSSLQQTSNNSTTASSNDDPTDASPKKKNGYVPIETWNENKYKKTNLTAEERLQFDCQRQGDRFKQNEILRKNLHYFG